jgi:predicted Rossmann fold nucleotide-binding protein DprA/Smf involved in DNA uptake
VVRKELKYTEVKMKYGIVGNRKGWSQSKVFDSLDNFSITANDIILSGGAEGVDTLAQEYAKLRGCEMIILYPNPNIHSPKRYFDRNSEIAKRCDTLIAFDKGSSSGSGTLNTINSAKKLGKTVVVFDI